MKGHQRKQETALTTYTPIETTSLRRDRRLIDGERTIASQQPDITGLTRFLGWFSIGLGVCEVLRPGAVSRIAGSNNHRNLVRFYGLREIAAGVGILTNPNPGKWLWARVAGDVVDIASIMKGSEKGVVSTGALAAVASVTALDIYCAKRATAEAAGTQDVERAETSLMINSSPAECYRYWREISNFPNFIQDLKSVQVTGDKTSRWTMALPGNAGEISWDAEITEDVPDQRIAWQSKPGSGATVNGSVNFEPAPGGRGTIVRVQLDYDFPGRTVAAPASRLLGMNPEQFANKSLRRFKQMLEVGEVMETQGQPAGRRNGTTWLDAIAR
jgi:uncharacterized membrane protein